jgi:F-type H+-transporting ATPase subunit c
MSLKRKLLLYAAVVNAVLLVPAIAFAKDAAAGATEWDTKAYLALGAGLCMGLAALGGTLGQGKATAAALDGIARQPSAQSKIQTPMILGLAFIESLVLFTWAMAFLLQGKIAFGG